MAVRFMVITLSQQSFHSLNCTTYSPLAIAKLATEKKKSVISFYFLRNLELSRKST